MSLKNEDGLVLEGTVVGRKRREIKSQDKTRMSACDIVSATERAKIKRAVDSAAGGYGLCLYAEMSQVRAIFALTERESTTLINTGLWVARADLGMGRTSFLVSWHHVLNVVSMRKGVLHAGQRA
jgi:hypothetical protein